MDFRKEKMTGSDLPYIPNTNSSVGVFELVVLDYDGIDYLRLQSDDECRCGKTFNNAGEIDSFILMLQKAKDQVYPPLSKASQLLNNPLMKNTLQRMGIDNYDDLKRILKE